jgi:XTP/dITP diphosphohydrolase
MSEALDDLVRVMDRLRSPGGCPWDAEQTHESLLTYLIEETHEFVDAVESGDRAAIREELGDVLLQVVFHARIGSEEPSDPFTIDDVARRITEKLIARHPHVFADPESLTSRDVAENWEQIKASEKGRTSAVEGVPMGQPALALASKLMHRATRHQVAVDVDRQIAPPETVTPQTIGALLLAVVALSDDHGIDPEAALRQTSRDYADLIRSAESNR